MNDVANVSGIRLDAHTTIRPSGRQGGLMGHRTRDGQGTF
jgi:hypothetical protein